MNPVRKSHFFRGQKLIINFSNGVNLLGKIDIVLVFFVIILGAMMMVVRLASPDLTDDPSFVILKGEAVKVEIADEPAEWTLGLSSRESIDKNSGMLFLFPKKQVHSFWMKDMNFDIDLLWISGQKIVGMEKNMPISTTTADDNLPRYLAPEPIDKVLEVKAGTIDNLQLQLEDELDFINI